MRPVTVTTSDASGGEVDSAPIPMDYVASIPFNVGIGCIVTGTVSYSVQHTFDGTNWFENANISDLDATADTNYMFPVLQIRLAQKSGSGSVVMTVIQTGPGR
jgi:hypothetical protein